jgi:hypothetical protein
MLRYSFREGPLTFKNHDHADPQAIGEALAKISAANSGRLETKVVLKAASNRTHILHKHLEWNDAIAADHWRQEQVREIIGVIRVTDDASSQEPESRRAFLSINDKKEGRHYRTVQDVLNSRDLQLKVLQQAERDLEAWQIRYGELREICDIVMTARARLQEQIARAQKEARA